MLTGTDFSVQNRMPNYLSIVRNWKLIGGSAINRLNLERVQSRFKIFLSH